MGTKEVELKVKGQQFEADKYRDMVRIDSIHRGPRIRSGQLIHVCVKGKGKECIIVAVRGVYREEDGDEDCIFIDLQTRRRLEVGIGETHTFRFRRASWWEAVKWAAQANDPAARVATWIALVAFGFSLIDILLSLTQLWQGAR